MTDREKGTLEALLERIDRAAQHSHRSGQDITLVAVTKTISFDRILPFIQAGLHHVAENRVQEAVAKYGMGTSFAMMHAPVSLHLIGQLQTNKAKKAAETFRMIQSLDREDLGDALNRHAEQQGRWLECLVQVKISPEESKSGLAQEALEGFLDHAARWKSLSIRGLMGIAPYGDSPESARPFFAKLRKLFEKTKLSVLSMGMSHDFEVAIEEGSTMIRLGTALFGQRQVL